MLYNCGISRNLIATKPVRGEAYRCCVVGSLSQSNKMGMGERYSESGAQLSPDFMARRPAESYVGCIPLVERSTSCLVRIVLLTKVVLLLTCTLHSSNTRKAGKGNNVYPVTV